MIKRTARIENWYVLDYKDNRKFLIGNIKDHPAQENFDPNQKQMTSAIVKMDEENGICETRNTIYTLGKKYEDDKTLEGKAP